MMPRTGCGVAKSQASCIGETDGEGEPHGEGRKPKTTPPGARFTAHGEVIKTVGNDLGIRVRNEAEMREFWRVNQIDTRLDWFGPGAPVVSIGRKQDISRCRPGDEAGITFVAEDRAGGKRGTRTVGFGVRSRTAPRG